MDKGNLKYQSYMEIQGWPTNNPPINNENRKWAILDGPYKQPYFFENLVKRCMPFFEVSKQIPILEKN